MQQSLDGRGAGDGRGRGAGKEFLPTPDRFSAPLPLVSGAPH